MSEQNPTRRSACVTGGAIQRALPYTDPEKRFAAEVRDCHTHTALPINVTKYSVPPNTPPTIASSLESPFPVGQFVAPYEQLRQNGSPLYDIATFRTALAEGHCVDEFASAQTVRPLVEFPQ